MSAAAKNTDREQGVYAGRSVARRFVSPDGWIVLVGRTARDNDIVSIKLARPGDWWLHAAGQTGAHVLVIEPPDERGRRSKSRLPRETLRFAASLAAGYSDARSGGQVAVHVARAADVSKARGAPPGQVQLKRYDTVHAPPLREEDLTS